LNGAGGDDDHFVGGIGGERQPSVMRTGHRTFVRRPRFPAHAVFTRWRASSTVVSQHLFDFLD
jgi:hypothetical protein